MQRAGSLTNALPVVVVLVGVAACGGDAGPTPPTPTPPPPPPPPVAPVQVGTIPNQTVATGQTATLDVSSFFRDPDGGALTYTAESSATAVVSVSLSGSTLTLTGVADGTATVTVTARDPDGLTAAQSFGVTVETPNRAPEAVGTIPAQQVTVGATVTLDVSSYFRDPDGDALTYTAASSAPGVVSASQSGSTLTLSGVAEGRAAATVVAADPGGLTATQGVAVTVQAGFDDDFDSAANLGGWTTHNTTTSVAGGVLHLTNTTPDRLGVAERTALPSTLTEWTMQARMGRAERGASPGVVSLTGHGRFSAVRFVLRTLDDTAGASRNYEFAVFDSREQEWILATNLSGDSDAINEGTGEFTEITLGVDSGRGAGGDFVAFAGEEELFRVNLGRAAFEGVLFGELLRHATGVWLVSQGAVGVTSLHDRVRVTGTESAAPRTDGGGALEATDVATLTASVTPSRPPEPVGTVPAQTVAVGAAVTLDVTSYFRDPDGDALTYAASSSSTDVATADVAGSSITIRGVADGTATVTVTATDPDDLSAAQEFDVTVSGSRVTNLTNHSADDWSPAWSPDGTQIAFTSFRDDANFPEIYAMNADGSGQTNLTNHPASDAGAAWSPDGTRIAFGSDRGDRGGNFEIYVMNADGSGVTRLTNHSARDVGPAWSPDGARIAFTSRRDGNAEIYAMNADGSGVTRLTDHSADDYHPTWSPDGARIAFTSRRDGNREIYSMNADGSGVTRLTNHAAFDAWPAWSPDGTRISFASDRDGNFEVHVMNANGSGVTRLTNHSEFDGAAAWSPDGARIAFESERDGNADVYVMDVPALPPPPPPMAPVAVGTIPDQTVAPGQTATLDVSSFFRDPEGGALTYTAASSAPAVVSVSVSRSTLTMAGVADGSGTVTVTARDPDGLTAEQRFGVTVGGGGSDDHSCVRGRETVLAWAGSAAGVLTAGDEDCFVVIVPSAAPAGRLTAWTTGDTDTYGTLYDSSYGVIDENDDWVLSSTSFNFLVTHDAASPGRYYIRVGGYDSDESGPYTIHVDDHGDSFESATVDWDARGFDSFANSGSIAAPGNGDFFAFFLFESALTSVGTTGSMDTHGVLYDEYGGRIDEDDDSGPGRNFQIERQLEAGIYFVEVRGAGNSTGSYELGVGAVGARHSAYPAWSPDGSRIAFTSDRDGSVDIYVMNADGSGVTRLTNDAAWSLIPAWSPDGSRIAFTSSRGDSLEIRVMRADGSGVTRLTGGSEWNDASPAWSPDGSRIAFQSDRGTYDSDPDTYDNFQIHVMNADGSGVTRLTRDSDWDDGFPAWSPDGSRIAFASDRADGFNYQVYVMNADGSGVTRLTGGPGWEATAPAWSPDGSRIAFSSDRDDDLDIYAMNADGTGVTRLTSDPADDFYTSWSPDGSRIAFSSARDGNFEIYAMNADGTGLTRLTNTAAEGDAADGLVSEWLREGSGPVFRFGADRNHKILTADAAPGRDALLGSVPKQPALKTVPQRRRGRRQRSRGNVNGEVAAREVHG